MPSELGNLRELVLAGRAEQEGPEAGGTPLQIFSYRDASEAGFTCHLPYSWQRIPPPEVEDLLLGDSADKCTFLNHLCSLESQSSPVWTESSGMQLGKWDLDPSSASFHAPDGTSVV